MLHFVFWRENVWHQFSCRRNELQAGGTMRFFYPAIIWCPAEEVEAIFFCMICLYILLLLLNSCSWGQVWTTPDMMASLLSDFFCDCYLLTVQSCESLVSNCSQTFSFYTCSQVYFASTVTSEHQQPR